jgi:hypothetical protein
MCPTVAICGPDSPIDNSPFSDTPEHKFLYHYRAFAHTYYVRAHKFSVIDSAFKELAAKEHPVQLKSLAEKLQINRDEVRELEPHKIVLEKQLATKDWSEIEGFAFVGEVMPDILTTECFGPRKDFQGRIIQDCKSKAPISWVSLTITASGDRAVFLLCAKKDSLVLRQMVNSFRVLPAASRTATVVSYVFCHFENFILLPKWWEGLSKEVRLKFVNAFQGRYFPRELANTHDWRLKEMTSQN